jgi:hypothetical protein
MRVERRFCGPPSRPPEFVFVRGSFGQGEFLVDGFPSEGLLMHFLGQIVPSECGMTQRLDGAVVDLGLLCGRNPEK